jgi:hypothetical protein
MPEVPHVSSTPTNKTCMARSLAEYTVETRFFPSILGDLVSRNPVRTGWKLLRNIFNVCLLIHDLRMPRHWTSASFKPQDFRLYLPYENALYFTRRWNHPVSRPVCCTPNACLTYPGLGSVQELALPIPGCPQILAKSIRPSVQKSQCYPTVFFPPFAACEFPLPATILSHAITVPWMHNIIIVNWKWPHASNLHQSIFWRLSSWILSLCSQVRFTSPPFVPCLFGSTLTTRMWWAGRYPRCRRELMFMEPY